MPPDRRLQNLNPSERKSLRKALLRWYDTNKRDLPWRSTHDPYRVWVSEIMLQQTRVAAVLGYYRRFLELFPSVESLASADLDAVLAAWSGLGYYRRARAMHAASKVLAAGGGVFPATPQELAELPGIGRYTAVAIASIAFEFPAAVLDGNVERVLARLFAKGFAKEESWRKARGAIERGTSRRLESGDDGAWRDGLRPGAT